MKPAWRPHGSAHCSGRPAVEGTTGIAWIDQKVSPGSYKVEGDRVVRAQAEKAEKGSAMYGVHIGSVLHDHVRETVTAQLCEHPAHYSHRVGQNTSVTAQSSPTFVLSGHSKILTRTTGDDQDEGARR